MKLGLMKLIVAVSVFLIVANAQQNTWLNLHSCNSCFGPGLCFNENDKLPSDCTSCITENCDNQLGFTTLATFGLACIQRAWTDPQQCQRVCQQFTIFHLIRVHHCSNCLMPCIGTVLNQGIGQCSIMTSFQDDPCVSESTKPCGTCFRANRCFSEHEIDGFGGICKGFLKLKCPGLSNITCMEEAFKEPCSTCPRNAFTDGRFQACKLCMNQCEAKKSCVSQCRSNITKYPEGVSCPICRAFCQVTNQSKSSNCEATHCKQCFSCDDCYEKCNDLPGGDFNLFNPCKCLNNEMNAPVIMQAVQGRILGGSTSCEGDWPWIAYLYERKSSPRVGGLCGGTLFNNKWIITAAHCIETNDPDIYAVILGEHDLSVISGREVFRNVSRIVKHPFYDALTFDYDVAVLELSKPVTFNENIHPLAIAAPGTPTDNTFPPSFSGELCSTIGWGLTASPGGSTSNSLMQLSLRITPRVLCEIQTLKGYAQGPVIEGAPKFCAGAVAGEDTCEGDSGGPLFCLQPDGTYLLHGIISYGTPVCGQQGLPGVYTKVGDVSTWINMCISADHCSL